MGYVGKFGDISFNVSNNSILSFHDMQRSSNAEFEEHAISGEKSYMEFLGPGLEEITLTIEASAKNGINPRDVESKLFAYERSGEAYNLTIGQKKIGQYKWVITSLSESFKEFYMDGRPISIAFSVTLKEYRGKTSAKKKKTTKKAAKTSKKKSKKKSGATKQKTAKKVGYEVYTVKKGDTLWGLAKKYYGAGSKYSKIYNANKKKAKGFNVITNPNNLSIGWVIKIPK